MTDALTTRLQGAEPQAAGKRGLFGWLLQFILWAGDAFTVLALTYFVLRWTVGERLGLVALSNVLLQWLLLPAFMFFALSFLRRWWPRRVVLGGLSLAYLVLYGGMLIPGGVAATDDAITFAVYNIFGDHLDPPDFAEYVLDTDIDVVGLVENDEWAGEALAELLADTHPHAITVGEGAGGKVLISRYPVTDQEIFMIVTERPNIYAELDVNGTPVHVYVLHPPSPEFGLIPPRFTVDPDHAPEIDEIVARATSHDAPTILMGDFNLPDQSPAYGQIRRAGFTDSFRAAGWGYGSTYSLFGMGPALTRIDYIWLSSDHWQAVDAFVAPEMWSDHRALVARAQLTQ